MTHYQQQLIKELKTVIDCLDGLFLATEQVQKVVPYEERIGLPSYRDMFWEMDQLSTRIKEINQEIDKDVEKMPKTYVIPIIKK